MIKPNRQNVFDIINAHIGVVDGFTPKDYAETKNMQPVKIVSSIQFEQSAGFSNPDNIANEFIYNTEIPPQYTMTFKGDTNVQEIFSQPYCYIEINNENIKDIRIAFNTRQDFENFLHNQTVKVIVQYYDTENNFWRFLTHCNIYRP